MTNNGATLLIGVSIICIANGERVFLIWIFRIYVLEGEFYSYRTKDVSANHS